MTSAWRRATAVDRAQWDALVAVASDGNAFQRFGWGEVRRRAGWTPSRWLLVAEERTVGLAQVLERRGPLGIALGWCPGGPVVGTDAAAPGELAERLRAFVEAQPGRSYLRFDSYLEGDERIATALRAVAARPRRRLTTGTSTVLDLTAAREDFLAAMKHKHRYNLRRALDLPIRWRRGGATEARALAALYAEMLAAKRLRARRPPDAQEIAAICRELGPSAHVLIGELDGRDVVGCLALITGERAFLHIPVTGGERRNGVAYAMVDVLAGDLRALGVRSLDLAGIDPDGRSPGVDRFKLGFGGRVTTRLGEWERAEPGVLRFAVEALLALRGPAVG